MPAYQGRRPEPRPAREPVCGIGNATRAAEAVQGLALHRRNSGQTGTVYYVAHSLPETEMAYYCWSAHRRWESWSDHQVLRQVLLHERSQRGALPLEHQ